MKLGLFTCGYQYQSLEQAFYDAHMFHYDYIELWGGFPHAFPADLLPVNGRQSRRAERIRSLSRRFRIPILVYTPEHNSYPYNFMLGDNDNRSQAIRYLEDAIVAAHQIGAPKMLLSVGHGNAYDSCETRWNRLRDTLTILVDKALEQDVTLLLETLTPYESDTCTKLDELERILDEIDSPNLSGMCDIVAPFSQGEDPSDYLRRLGKRCEHIHFVDNDGKSDTHLIPGEGCMPLADILKDVHRLGYHGTATIELVTNYIQHPTLASKTAIRNMRTLMQSAYSVDPAASIR